jgi:hypothetical protein
MAWAYRLGLWRRLVNRIIRVLLRLGVSPPHIYLLTVAGRKPAALLNTRDTGGKRWGTLASGAVWRSGLGTKRSCSQVGYANAWSQITDRKHSGTLGRGRRSGAKEVSCPSACGTTIL